MRYSAIFTLCTAIVQNRIVLREFQRPTGATNANRAVARIWLAALPLCVFCSLPADVSAVEESKPLLFANYYAWYHDGSHTARPWGGWTRKESEHNARALAEQRSGEPPRSSAAYPLAGLYDSADPEVAEWHVRLAQAAGIDAFLVDWWGTHLGRDKNIDPGILVAAEKHGFKFALLDERAQCALAGTLEAGEVVSPAAAGTLLRVADFGAVGDGVRDDAPAIAAAFAAAKENGGPSTVVFEKKTYKLGDHPTAWHHFPLHDYSDLVIDGNGATLLCSHGNLGFHFNGGRNITVRDLVFDTIVPGFTQGQVVALDDSGSLDVQIMEGYPEPPDEAFLAANRHQAHGGGGRHMIVFEQGGKARNARMGSDHLYIRNITRVSPSVFRFHVKEDYVPRMKGMAVGIFLCPAAALKSR